MVGRERRLEYGARIGTAGRGSRAAWVHAYLHRKEGDSSNAAYWYRRAGKDLPQTSLEHEWREITKALLAE